ncbi:MAG: ABC transporter substrate-binding protein [Thalassotalea sp.]|nr:ABC transporter substrate-binding protein [Thalassotalea sp.]
MNRKLSLFIALTLLLIASVIFLSINLQHFWQEEKHSVTIAVSKTPLSSPFYVAKAINAFKNTCVDVKFDNVVGGQKAFAKVIAGDVDFGTSSDSVIAFQSLSNQPFVTHAVFVQSDNDVKLITRQADNINSVLSLKGKKIGVTKSTASEYFLSTLLAIEGLNVEDVELINYEPELLIDGLTGNEVDAITPWEPFAFQSKQLFNEKLAIHDTKNLNTLSFNLISLTPYIQRLEKAKCVLQGLNTAIDYIASNPKEAKNIVINELGITSEFINWVWPDYIFKLELNQSLLLNLKSQASWLAEIHFTTLDELPNINRFVDSRAMLQVNPNAVNIPQ